MVKTLELKEKIKNYQMILSVLLEQSLESSFEVGEAAYTRGFLSTKRSVYERIRFGRRDAAVLSALFFPLGTFIVLSIRGSVDFNLYFGDGLDRFSDPLWLFFVAFCLLLSIITLLTESGKPLKNSEELWDI